MTTPEFIKTISELGGYGIAAVFWWLWKQEKEERVRYRDMFERLMQEIPELTSALKELRDVVVSGS